MWSGGDTSHADTSEHFSFPDFHAFYHYDLREVQIARIQSSSSSVVGSVVMSDNDIAIPGGISLIYSDDDSVGDREYGSSEGSTDVYSWVSTISFLIVKSIISHVDNRIRILEKSPFFSGIWSKKFGGIIFWCGNKFSNVDFFESF